jgi:hypothetical protein
MGASSFRVLVLMPCHFVLLLLLLPQTGLEQLRQFASTMKPGVSAR